VHQLIEQTDVQPDGAVAGTLPACRLGAQRIHDIGRPGRALFHQNFAEVTPACCIRMSPILFGRTAAASEALSVTGAASISCALTSSCALISCTLTSCTATSGASTSCVLAPGVLISCTASGTPCNRVNLEISPSSSRSPSTPVASIDANI